MRSPSYSFIRHYYKINSMSSNFLYLIETQTKDKEIRVDFTPQKREFPPLNNSDLLHSFKLEKTMNRPVEIPPLSDFTFI